MKTHCGIIRDLIPLYVENMLSPQSVALVEEHLKECEDCRCDAEEQKKNERYAAQMNTEYVSQADQIKGFRKKLRTRKIIIIILQIVLFVLIIGGYLFGQMACDRLKPTKIDYGTSELHSLNDRKLAINCVRDMLEKNQEKLYSLVYAGDDYSYYRAAQYSVPPEDIIVVHAVYRAKPYVTELNGFSMYDRGFVLKKDENGDWVSSGGVDWRLMRLHPDD